MADEKGGYEALGVEICQLVEELRKTKATLTDLETWVMEQKERHDCRLDALEAKAYAIETADKNSGLEFIRHSIAKIRDDFNHHHHQVQNGLFSSKAIV